MLMDQLCYEVDPNKYIKNLDMKEKISLILLIDFNEDRQISMDKMISNETTEDTNLLILEKNEVKGEVFIESIGSRILINIKLTLSFRSSEIEHWKEIQFEHFKTNQSN